MSDNTNKVRVANGGKRRVIRRRTHNHGSVSNPRKVTIRMTERESAELASIQGLCRAYGRRETLSGLWREVAMPAIREFVKGYAENARADREARAAAREGVAV